MYLTPEPKEIALALDRPYDDGTDTYINAQIARAERQLTAILEQRGCQWDILAAHPTKSKLLHDAIVDAVARVERNPHVKAGFKNENEGNYGYGLSDSRDVSAHLWWPEDELNLLCPRRAPRIGTMQLDSHRKRW